MSSKFQRSVIEKYESMGYRVLKIMKLSENGYPDLQCLKDGKSVWIECKEKKDTLKPLQAYRIDELISLGFEAFCLQDGKGKIYPL